MLVLTRKINERILARIEEGTPIGSFIEIKVLEIQHSREGGRVRLGISAPDNVTVHRDEIWAKITQEENNQQGEKESTTCE